MTFTVKQPLRLNSTNEIVSEAKAVPSPRNQNFQSARLNSQLCLCHLPINLPLVLNILILSPYAKH